MGTLRQTAKTATSEFRLGVCTLWCLLFWIPISLSAETIQIGFRAAPHRLNLVHSDHPLAEMTRVAVTFALTRKNLSPEKSQAFSSALSNILGHGSTIIEDLIIESLYLSFGKELLWKKELSFSDYISQIRQLSPVTH